jgi:hypothetical protein
MRAGDAGEGVMPKGSVWRGSSAGQFLDEVHSAKSQSSEL